MRELIEQRLRQLQGKGPAAVVSAPRHEDGGEEEEVQVETDAPLLSRPAEPQEQQDGSVTYCPPRQLQPIRAAVVKRPAAGYEDLELPEAKRSKYESDADEYPLW